MSEPYTGGALKHRQEWAEKAVLDTKMSVTGRAVAWRELRFLATLQAKDEQIAALVKGVLDIDEWMSGRTCHICPFCRGQYDEHKAGCLRGIAEAIKGGQRW